MINKFYLYFCLFLISETSFVFGQNNATNATEVLKHYEQSLSHILSVSMKIDMEVDVDENSSIKQFCPYERNFIYRRDRNRTEWLGQTLFFDKQGDIDLQNSSIIKEIMTGELYVNLFSQLNNPPRAAAITVDYKARQEALLDDSGHGGALFGKMFGNNHKNVAKLLSESDNLLLRDNQDDINGISCYVLEGTGKYGRVTAWIAPEKGYSALKWSIEKRPNHLFDDERISTKWPEIQGWKAVFDSVSIQEVNNVFVTAEGTLTHTTDFTDGRKSITWDKYKVSEVKINPDFDKLGAFKIDLPNGTPVIMTEFQGIKYVWQDGKPITAIDQTFLNVLDNEIKQLNGKVKIEPVKVIDKKVNDPCNQLSAVVGMKMDAPKTDTAKLLVKAPFEFPVSALISIGLLIIGVLVWVAFRQSRKG